MRKHLSARAMWTGAVTALLLVSAAGLAMPAAQQRAGEKQMWDGVYTAAQAARGKALFLNSCSRCHNPELIGSERGPALKGELFWSHWEDDALLTLFTKIRDTMPQGGIESVPDEGKLDILAHILSVNEVPAGPEEMSLKPGVLENILVTKKGGAATPAVANFTLVDGTGLWAHRVHGLAPVTARHASANIATRHDLREFLRSIAHPPGTPATHTRVTAAPNVTAYRSVRTGPYLLALVSVRLIKALVRLIRMEAMIVVNGPWSEKPGTKTEASQRQNAVTTK